jgi:ribonuclease T2
LRLRGAPSSLRGASWRLRGALSRLLVAALLAALAGPALAQNRGGSPGAFDFYVLALSWSPSWCALTGEGRGSRQCEPGANPGFVVHGLWPQYERGYPSDCDAFPRQPSRIAMEEARGVFPEEGLARYEWRKHGSCSGLDPAAYFRAARTARDAVSVPDGLSGGRLAPIEIARRFVAANPGLRPDMMAVTCRRDRLEEVRICFTRDLRGFQRCPEVARGNCRAGDVLVEAGR